MLLTCMNPIRKDLMPNVLPHPTPFGKRSSLFQNLSILSISWFRLNITDLTVHRLPRHLKFQMM